MKKILLATIITAVIACNSGTGEDRQETQGTTNENIDNIPATESNLGDTTPTSNNNMYNADSPAGKGGVYDTAARKGR